MGRKHVYVLSLMVLYVVVFAGAIGSIDYESLWVILLLAAIIFGTERLSVPLPLTKGSVSIALVFDIAAILTLPWGYVVLGSSLGHFLADVRHKKAWDRLLFNVAQIGLGNAVASWFLMSNGITPGFFVFADDWVILVLTGLIRALVNIALVTVFFVLAGYLEVYKLGEYFKNGPLIGFMVLVPMGIVVALIFDVYFLGLLFLLPVLFLNQQAIKHQVKLGCENLMLSDQNEHLQEEVSVQNDELQKVLLRLKHLQSVGIFLVQEVQMSRALETVARELTLLTNSDQGFIALFSETGELEVKAWGREEYAFKPERLDPQEPLVRDTLSGIGVRIGSLSSRRLDFLEGFNGESALFVPLRDQAKVLGLCGVLSERSCAYGELDMQTATILANQAFIAIEKDSLQKKAREAAVLAERQRLSRELHDSMTQSLFSISLHAEAALTYLDKDRDKAIQALHQVRDASKETSTELRSLIYELQPEALSAKGLFSVIREHVSLFTRRSGILVELQMVGERSSHQLNKEQQWAIYRIVQEALNNVWKHAEVGEVELSLRMEDNSLRLSIKDRGIGFALDRVDVNTLGLKSMQERANLIDADFRIYTQVGLGTEVIVETKP